MGNVIQCAQQRFLESYLVRRARAHTTQKIEIAITSSNRRVAVQYLKWRVFATSIRGGWNGAWLASHARGLQLFEKTIILYVQFLQWRWIPQNFCRNSYILNSNCTMVHCAPCYMYTGFSALVRLLASNAFRACAGYYVDQWSREFIRVPWKLAEVERR